MNQKNYLFLVCVTMSHVLFSMENNNNITPSCFGYFGPSMEQDPVCDEFLLNCFQMQDAIKANKTELLANALDYFYDLGQKTDNFQNIEWSIKNAMSRVPSPLVYNIDSIKTLNEKIKTLNLMYYCHTSIENISDTKECKDLIKQKNQQFLTLKILCSTFPIFCSNEWSVNTETPLISACLCKVPMEDEVRILLAHNANPSQELTGDAPIKTALEAAQAFKHESIIQILQTAMQKSGDDNTDSDADSITRKKSPTGITKKTLEKKHQTLVWMIKNSAYPNFKSALNKDYINVDYVYSDPQKGQIPLVNIALKEYLISRDLFKQIVGHQVVDISQDGQKKVFNIFDVSQKILFDLIEKGPELNIDYTYSIDTEQGTTDIVSTPLKAAIALNARALITMLFKYGADLFYKGSDNTQLSAFDFVQQHDKDLENFVFKLYGAEFPE